MLRAKGNCLSVFFRRCHLLCQNDERKANYDVSRTEPLLEIFTIGSLVYSMDFEELLCVLTHGCSRGACARRGITDFIHTCSERYFDR